MKKENKLSRLNIQQKYRLTTIRYHPLTIRHVLCFGCEFILTAILKTNIEKSKPERNKTKPLI